MILITLDASAQNLPLVIVRACNGYKCEILFSREFRSIHDAKLAVKMLSNSLSYLGQEYKTEDRSCHCPNIC